MKEEKLKILFFFLPKILRNDRIKVMDNPHTNLARQAIENYIKTGRIINAPENLPEEFYSRRTGVFVTIKKDKELRGCIGTFLPARKNITQEIISNATSAATHDSRFLPIRKSELAELNYEVSILSKPEQIKSAGDLNPKKYGVLVKTDGGRSGLLLPDLEGVDSIEKQISIACQKGGIDFRKDKIILYRFKVKKYND